MLAVRDRFDHADRQRPVPRRSHVRQAPHPPPITAAALGGIAFFVALGELAGGGHVAQATGNLITGKQVRSAAITTKHVRDHSLLAGTSPGVSFRGDNKGPQGSVGRQGPKGDAGPEGPAGPSTGPAGGDLSGNYPNPEIRPGAVGKVQLAPAEAWREIGAAGQAGFGINAGATDSAWGNFDADHKSAAFYKGPYGVVHPRESPSAPAAGAACRPASSPCPPATGRLAARS